MTEPLASRESLTRALAKQVETVDHLTSVLNTERQTRRRFRFNLAALVVLAVLNLIGLAFAYQAADDAKNVAETLDSCLIPGGSCAARLATQGQSTLARQMNFQICWAQVEIPARTLALLEKCRDDILGDVVKDAEEPKRREK